MMTGLTVACPQHYYTGSTCWEAVCRSGNAAWKLQPEQSWTLNDTVVGSARQLGNLNFIKINGAVRCPCLLMAAQLSWNLTRKYSPA